MNDDVVIRPLTTLADMQPLPALQQAVWQSSPLETLPVHSFHALVHSGSSVIGAYDGDQLIGFVFSVPGFVDTPNRRDQVAAARLKLYSVMMGVHPDYRNGGIGYRLKLAQREFAQSIGIRLITWTFDPLQSRNAWLNITRLGTVCAIYHREFHGEMDGINAGIPSDRFEVAWWLNSRRVESRTTQQRRPLTLAALVAGGAVLVNPAVVNDNGRLTPSRTIDTLTDAPLLLVQIPTDHSAIKRADPVLAREWRSHTRLVFETLLARGYVVTDFVSEPGLSSAYLLTQGDGVTG